MWQNTDTVAELNECDNEGRLNKMAQYVTTQKSCDSATVHERGEINIFNQRNHSNYLHARKLAKNYSKQN